MKNKLAFHADKMKFVCILYAVSIVANIGALCALMISSDYNYIGDSYFSHINYLNLISTALTGSALEFIPLVICIIALIYNRIKHKDKALIKICAYAMAAFNLLLFVLNFPKWNSKSEIFTSLFAFILPNIIYIVGFIFMGISDKRFEVSRACVLFAAGLKSVLSFVTAITTVTSADDTDVQFYNLNKFISCYYFGRCIYSIAFAAALAVLMFCVFKRDKQSIEDRIISLNQDYTSGKITKDSYDIQRKNLLKEL